MIWRYILALWTMVTIAVLTLPLSNFKGHSHWAKVCWVPFRDTSLSVADVVGDVALFVPFGFLFVQSRAKRSATTLLGAAIAAALISGSGEFYQVFCHNRFPTVTDICTNVFGAVAGAAVGFGMMETGHRKGRRDV